MQINFVQNDFTTFKSKKIPGKNTILTKPINQSKIDIFCKSNEVVEGLKKKFADLRDVFYKKLNIAYVKMCISVWDFETNSTDENLKKMNLCQNEYSKLYQNTEDYEKFKHLSNVELSKHDKKQLENILENFENKLNIKEEDKKLGRKKNEIAQKYNSYIFTIDGKEVSKAELSKIFETEKDPVIREKAYNSMVKSGDLIAEDLRELVKMRNEAVLRKGYTNFFEYKLKENYEIDVKDLENLMNEVYSNLFNAMKLIFSEKQEKLKEIFTTEDLKEYHYGYLADSDPVKKVNNCLKSKEQVVEISKKTYKGMGYDIEKMIKEGKLTLDLFPRKDKNAHGFSFFIDFGKDSRILANLTNNILSIDVLNHELGHSVHNLGVSTDLPFTDRVQHLAISEAVAMIMADLTRRENVLKDTVPPSVLEEFKQTFKENLAELIAKSLTLINFEKEMYKNPDQDLKKLWHDMKVKYRFRSENTEQDNEWATIPHYLSHPVYYQNYFRAIIMKAQMYNYLTSKLGNLTENSETAEFLRENLFKYGSSMEENELIEKFTGKKLSTQDLIKTLNI